MTEKRFKHSDLIGFGREVLAKLGYPVKQAQATATVLVEADLRGDFAHGLAGSSGLLQMVTKTCEPESLPGTKHMEVADYTLDEGRYPTVISADAHGTLGHYVAFDLLPLLMDKARNYGYAKAYIRNSTSFGDCGIYSEMIAEHGLAAKATCTSPQWTKPFIELQEQDNPDSPVNRKRYHDVGKRFGTNPIAWSIPYEGGIITIDMAVTQRAVSPVLTVAKHNSSVLGIGPGPNGALQIEIKGETMKLSQVHLDVATSRTKEEALAKLGRPPECNLLAAEKGLLKGSGDIDISFPLAFDELLQKEWYIAPLGGTYFGYKGFGLNMLIEMDNVIGGGASGLLRVLSQDGQPTTSERVSQTLEAYAIDAVMPLAQSKKRLRESVETTLSCGNDLMYLPGQREQENKKRHLAGGIPMTSARIQVLKNAAQHPQVGIEFDLQPMNCH